MESSFQTIVLGIAIIFLIIILVFIGYSLSSSKSAKTWPPKVVNCPDYWTETESASENTITCNANSDNNIGTYNNTFTDEYGEIITTYNYDKTKSLCEKYKWANQYKIAWDGISYGYGEYNPCETRPP
jgi:hypothetical protein